jgi:hypothetical protein
MASNDNRAMMQAVRVVGDNPQAVTAVANVSHLSCVSAFEAFLSFFVVQAVRDGNEAATRAGGAKVLTQLFSIIFKCTGW